MTAQENTQHMVPENVQVNYSTDERGVPRRTRLTFDTREGVSVNLYLDPRVEAELKEIFR